MSKPQASFKHSRTAYRFAGETMIRKLSRNSEVVNPSGPKRSLKNLNAASWELIAQFLNEEARKPGRKRPGLGWCFSWFPGFLILSGSIGSPTRSLREP